jgi:ABC-2 type transport system permease protein
MTQYFFNIILGYLAFWFTEVEGFVQSYIAVSVFLAGNVIPLNIIPTVGNYLVFLPFAFTFYHPMQIYLGKYDTNKTIYIFLGGLAWCIVLYFLAKIIFKMGLKRNESVGL